MQTRAAARLVLSERTISQRHPLGPAAHRSCARRCTWKGDWRLARRLRVGGRSAGGTAPTQRLALELNGRRQCSREEPPSPPTRCHRAYRCLAQPAAAVRTCKWRMRSRRRRHCRRECSAAPDVEALLNSSRAGALLRVAALGLLIGTPSHHRYEQSSPKGFPAVPRASASMRTRVCVPSMRVGMYVGAHAARHG